MKPEQVPIKVFVFDNVEPNLKNTFISGLGGGYNERGKVEYKDRVPSDDDEYDDVCYHLLACVQTAFILSYSIIIKTVCVQARHSEIKNPVQSALFVIIS